MRLPAFALAVWLVLPACAQDTLTLGDRAREYLIGLVKLDTTNPPGRETRAAEYLKGIAAANGIEAELMGEDPARLNFVARLRGTGRERPLLLMAHTDVVPADRAQWSVDPFAALIRDGYLYGRGAEDTKDLLAAEMAVLVEVQRRGLKLKRDVILLAEADEEAGSTGMRWLLENAWAKIDAEFALNAGAASFMNAVIEVEFEGSPIELLDGLQSIEARMGRPSKRLLEPAFFKFRLPRRSRLA